MRVAGAGVLPRAATLTPAANECLSDRSEKKTRLPAHLAQSIVMAGMAAKPAPSFQLWPWEMFCKPPLLMMSLIMTLSLMWVWNTCVRKCTRETRTTTCWVGIGF